MFAFRARSSSSFSASDFRRRPIPRKPIFVERRSFLFFFFSFGVWCYYYLKCGIPWGTSPRGYGVSRRPTPNKLVSLCGRFFFTHRRRFFNFSNDEKDNNTREGTQKKNMGKKYLKRVTRKKRRHSKNRHKKNDGRPFRESPRFGSIDRSIDRLLPPPSTEYTAIDKSPNLGIFFFLTRPCENARGVRVERATVVLWCLFSK